MRGGRVLVNWLQGPTGVQSVDGLLSGVKWSASTLTWSMPTAGAYYEYAGERDEGFQSLSATQAQAVKQIVTAAAGVVGIKFALVTETQASHATLRFGATAMTQTAWAYQPSAEPEGGDIWISSTSPWFTTAPRGGYAYFAIMHEFGHALGLKHGNEQGSFGVVPANRNSMEFTIMTYASYIGALVASGFRNAAYSYAQSLMMDDIAALQALYGANYSINAGSTVYRWDPLTGQQFINGVGQGLPAGNKIFMTVWDGGGVDTYDFAKYATNLYVDLRPGAWSTVSQAQRADLSGDGSKLARGNIANALLHANDARALIENAIGGSGNDSISGNATHNTLSGGAGSDTLNGLAGNDVLIGGPGADRLYGGDGYDTVSYAGAQAVKVDLLTGGKAGDAAGDVYSSIEQVIGTSYADELWGSAASDRLNGGAGNDLIDGRGGADVLVGGAGADRLNGGDGFDTITYAGAQAVVVDLLNGGKLGDAAGDVYSSIEQVIGTSYADHLWGGNMADRLDGSGGNDLLFGRDGNDVMIGDAGSDILTGGGGNDTFLFRQRADFGDIIMDFQVRIDKVQFAAAALSHSLPAGALQAGNFAQGSAAMSKAASFIYNPQSGVLSFDADGSGSQAPLTVTIFKNLPALSAGDILIV